MGGKIKYWVINYRYIDFEGRLAVSAGPIRGTSFEDAIANLCIDLKAQVSLDGVRYGPFSREELREFYANQENAGYGDDETDVK
jgi:hypothetical protein